jgi:sugar-specific transcriptional regulator TrmB
MHIGTVIEQLGYPKSEVRIYVASLDIGEATITDLAAKVNMPRTSVQSIIDDMQRRGLMNCYLKRKRKYWVAENPDKLMIKLKESEAALKTIMPELQAKRFSHGGRPLVRLYNGVEQIKLVMEEIIAAQHHILATVDWDDWRALVGGEFMDDFIESRGQHFLHIRLLAPKTALSQELKQRDEKELRRTRFLPSGTDIKTSNFIFGNTLAIISLNKRRPIAIVMEDPDIAHTAAISFEALWQQSSDN